MDVVEIALKEIGTSEYPAKTNQTKYGKWFGLDGLPWCGMFVSWCFHQAGRSLGNIGYKKGFAGCQTAHVYYKEKGCITKNPTRGDIVLYDWNKDGRYDHTGIFIEKIDEETFSSVEGNTSISNNSNGGQVMLRKRTFKQAIFIHPNV